MHSCLFISRTELSIHSQLKVTYPWSGRADLVELNAIAESKRIRKRVCWLWNLPFTTFKCITFSMMRGEGKPLSNSSVYTFFIISKKEWCVYPDIVQVFKGLQNFSGKSYPHRLSCQLINGKRHTILKWWKHIHHFKWTILVIYHHNNAAETQPQNLSDM